VSNSIVPAADLPSSFSRSSGSSTSLSSIDSTLSSISTDTQSSTQSTDTIKPRAKGIYGGEWDLRLPANNPKELLDYSYNYDIADHGGVAIAVESSDDESDARRGPPTDKEIAKR